MRKFVVSVPLNTRSVFEIEAVSEDDAMVVPGNTFVVRLWAI